jgi:hypothetical protein
LELHAARKVPVTSSGSSSKDENIDFN